MTGSPKPEVRFAKRRILIVDDHPIVRRGIAQLLADAPDVEVCGGAESVAEAHREKIKTKLDLKNASQLIQRAAQWMLENG